MGKPALNPRPVASVLLVFLSHAAWADDCSMLLSLEEEASRRLEECSGGFFDPSERDCEQEKRDLNQAATNAGACRDSAPVSDAFAEPSPEREEALDVEIFAGTRRSTGTWSEAAQTQGGLAVSIGAQAAFVVGFLHSEGKGRLRLSDDDGAGYGQRLSVSTTEFAFGGRLVAGTVRFGCSSERVP